MRLVRRPKWTNVGFYLARDLRSRFTIDLNTHGQSRGQPTAESVAYVERAFEGFLREAPLDPAEIEGARLLELGPGDNLGLALRFLAAGARQVVTLDKFAVRRDRDAERAIYRELVDRLDPRERERCAGVLRDNGKVAFDPERLSARAGIAIEDADRTLEPGSFDLILSVAVLEHLYDSDSAFAAMDRLLRPGGLMLHQIDFRDHNMFTAGGRHPLEFLTVNDRLWRWMTLHSGGPNRRLLPYYRDRMREQGYDAKLLVNQMLGVEGDIPCHDVLRAPLAVGERQRELIGSIRPRLLPRFRDLPDEDLAAAGLFLVARKPG